MVAAVCGLTTCRTAGVPAGEVPDRATTWGCTQRPWLAITLTAASIWTMFTATPWPNAAVATSDGRHEGRSFGAVNMVQMLRSEEHTSELQSHLNLVCRLLL